MSEAVAGWPWVVRISGARGESRWLYGYLYGYLIPVAMNICFRLTCTRSGMTLPSYIVDAHQCAPISSISGYVSNEQCARDPAESDKPHWTLVSDGCVSRCGVERLRA